MGEARRGAFEAGFCHYAWGFQALVLDYDWSKFDPETIGWMKEFKVIKRGWSHSSQKGRNAKRNLR